MSVVVNNPRGADTDPPPAPRHPDGTPYRYEMICHGFTTRVYADDAGELLDELIPGYQTMGPAAQLAARLHFAVRAQVAVQAALNDDYGLDQCTPQEYAVLQGSRNTPPEIDEWTCPVPLVLVDVYYQPLGELPRPVGSAHVTEPDNIIWLSPTDPYEFLVSLHRAGVVALRAHVDGLPG